MESKKQLFEKIANEYMMILLSWAYKKLGDKDKAEELTQEVFLQIYSALKKSGEEVAQIEHFVWKVAHYTWCNYLRKYKRYSRLIPMDELLAIDERDFVSEMVEGQAQEEVLNSIRKSISGLSYLKREIMVSFYIDRKQIKEIATQYGLTESSVKWYLHSSRKRIKEEVVMKQSDYVYRPKKLHMAISGQVVAAPDTKVINQSLSMQNICLACYPHAMTKKELAEVLGLPMAYIESDLEWLTEKEFVSVIGEKYATTFVIEDLKQTQDIYKIYCKHKEKFMNVVVEGLSEKEEIIRAIGFKGSDMPMEKLLWLLIYQFCNVVKKPEWIEDAPIRPDGGKYFPLGFDRNVDTVVGMEDYSAGWGYNGPMHIDGFRWFGLYNFSDSEIVNLLDGYDGQATLHKMLKKILDDMKPNGVSELKTLSDDERLLCAELVQRGFVTIENNEICPTFCVFDKKQYEELVKKVFKPLADKIAGEARLLQADFQKYFRGKMPPQLKDYEMFCVRRAMYDMSFICTIEAFKDGRLYVPENKTDGEFLTLMYIKE